MTLPFRSGGQDQETLAVPSAQCVARSGSESEAMRMIPARFTCVRRRSTRCLDIHLLLLFQEVGTIRKTCNQLVEY